jgi:hypothetical protein
MITAKPVDQKLFTDDHTPQRKQTSAAERVGEEAYRKRFEDGETVVEYGYYHGTYIPRIVITSWRGGLRVHIYEPNLEAADAYLARKTRENGSENE